MSNDEAPELEPTLTMTPDLLYAFTYWCTERGRQGDTPREVADRVAADWQLAIASVKAELEDPE